MHTVGECACRVQGCVRNVRNLLNCFTLCTEAESVNQTHSSLIWLVLLTRLLWGAPVFDGIWGYSYRWAIRFTRHLCGLWGFELWSSCLYGEYYNHWAIIPGQDILLCISIFVCTSLWGRSHYKIHWCFLFLGWLRTWTGEESHIWTWLCFYKLYIQRSICIYEHEYVSVHYICVYIHIVYIHTRTHTYCFVCVCVCLHGSWTYLDIWICVSIYQIALPVWVRAWNLEVLTLETSLSLSSAGTKSCGRTETVVMARDL